MSDANPQAQGTDAGPSATPSPSNAVEAKFENADAAKQAEQAALNVHAKLNVNALPVRQYLEATVVPLIMQAMQAVVRERPENPVEFVAAYLLKHNPQKDGKPSGASKSEAP